ncbi:MAG: hypothetical protein ABIN69_11060 [Aestuariivirga sp.]
MKILLESEIEAHICFPRDKKDFVVRVDISEINIEFYLRNGNVELGTEHPTLISTLVFEGQSLETGFEEGREKVIQILSALTAVTSSTFKYRKSIRLVDWSEGLKERAYKVIKAFPGHELPYEYLDPGLISSAMRIWASPRKGALQLGVHWFASGISSRLPEDQFQFFWFTLELVAEHFKPTEKVNDTCVKCRAPLYCESCGTYPKHRPFNSQSIATLIKGSMNAEDGQVVCDRLFKVRNMLMHGSMKSEIEKEIGTELILVVNELAKIARNQLFELVRQSVSSSGPNDNLFSLEIEDYSHKVLHLTVNMVSGPFEAKYDRMNQLAMPELALKFQEKQLDVEAP